MVSPATIATNTIPNVNVYSTLAGVLQEDGIKAVLADLATKGANCAGLTLAIQPRTIIGMRPVRTSPSAPPNPPLSPSPPFISVEVPLLQAMWNGQTVSGRVVL